MNDAAKPARAQPALSNGFINGNDAADFERGCQLLFGGIGAAVFGSFADDFELRLSQLEFAAAVVLLDLAVKRDNLAGFEFVPEVSGVEPDALQSRAALPRGHLKNGHAAGAEKTRSPHFRNHSSHFTCAQFSNAPRVQPVLITKWQVVQQVVEGLDSLACEQFSQLRSHPLHVFNGRAQLQHLKGC